MQYSKEEKQWLDRLWNYISNGRPLCMQPKGWWSRIFCKHDRSHWLSNLYGDGIPSNGHRSLWQCTRCGSIGTKPELEREREKQELGPSPFMIKGL